MNIFSRLFTLPKKQRDGLKRVAAQVQQNELFQTVLRAAKAGLSAAAGGVVAAVVTGITNPKVIALTATSTGVAGFRNYLKNPKGNTPVLPLASDTATLLLPSTPPAPEIPQNADATLLPTSQSAQTTPQNTEDAGAN